MASFSIPPDMVTTVPGRDSTSRWIPLDVNSLTWCLLVATAAQLSPTATHWSRVRTRMSRDHVHHWLQFSSSAHDLPQCSPSQAFAQSILVSCPRKRSGLPAAGWGGERTRTDKHKACLSRPLTEKTRSCIVYWGDKK